METKLDKTVHFLGEECTVYKGRYLKGGQTSLQLKDAQGFPMATATVNITTPEIEIPEGCVIIKDYSENEGMTEALIDAGIIEDKPVCKIALNYVVVYGYKLLV